MGRVDATWCDELLRLGLLLGLGLGILSDDMWWEELLGLDILSDRWWEELLGLLLGLDILSKLGDKWCGLLDKLIGLWRLLGIGRVGDKWCEC